MKHFLYIVILWASFLLHATSPYSHLKEIDTQSPDAFLANTLLQKDEITYCLVTSVPESKEELEKHIATYIEAALREWTYGIALRIREAGRVEEFKDILATLEKPLRITRLPNCDLSDHEGLKTRDKFNAPGSVPDILMIVSENYCVNIRKQSVSFYVPQWKGRYPFICLTEIWEQDSLRSITPGEYIPNADSESGSYFLANREEIFKKIIAGRYTSADQKNLWKLDRFFSYDSRTIFFIVAHELGHAFGLNDEYVSERPTQYASREPGDSLMMRSYTAISCDEIDGMITLLDRFSRKDRTFQSFCPNRGKIINGTEQE